MNRKERENKDLKSRIENKLILNEIKNSNELIYERVIEFCIKKNIITSFDKDNLTSDFIWLKKVIKMKIDAMNLLDGDNLEIHTYEQALNLTKSKEFFVIEKIAEKIIDGIPAYIKR
ncbi:hypothetical protein [Vibrio parahaemolyticus]|uniref:hypothetical protein n=1 Tax=Vibrio parahaemolyticus TaxID=670 RepID=UPI001121754C|nr:hypothetical protein [Vibrio parahaemolyticus]TNZ95745.1 hypothetical protein CGK38_03250 [Vibrio parahaemolyticus]